MPSFYPFIVMALMMLALMALAGLFAWIGRRFGREVAGNVGVLLILIWIVLAFVVIVLDGGGYNPAKEHLIDCPGPPYAVC